MKLATVPLTVNEAEPLDPVVKDNPVVDANVSVPCVTDSVNESGLPAEPASVIEIALPLALEKMYDVFSLTVAADGAVIAGGLRALMVSATLFEEDWPSPGSATPTDNESVPM